MIVQNVPLSPRPWQSTTGSLPGSGTAGRMCRTPSRQPSACRRSRRRRAAGRAIRRCRRIVAQPGTPSRTRMIAPRCLEILPAGRFTRGILPERGVSPSRAPLLRQVIGISAAPAGGFLPKRELPGNARPVIAYQSGWHSPQIRPKFTILSHCWRARVRLTGRPENQVGPGDETRGGLEVCGRIGGVLFCSPWRRMRKSFTLARFSTDHGGGDVDVNGRIIAIVVLTARAGRLRPDRVPDVPGAGGGSARRQSRRGCVPGPAPGGRSSLGPEAGAAGFDTS